VKILDAVDPARDLLRVLIGMLNGFDIHRSSSHNVTFLDVTQLNNRLVLRVQSRLVEHGDAKIFFGAIWLRHLEERIDFSD